MRMPATLKDCQEKSESVGIYDNNVLSKPFSNEVCGCRAFSHKQNLDSLNWNDPKGSCSPATKCTQTSQCVCVSKGTGMISYNCGSLDISWILCLSVNENQLTIIHTSGADSQADSSEADSDTTPPYLCQDGAGESEATVLKGFSICDKTQCEKECTKDVKCMGYDFAKECKSDSCRLFPINIPRLKNIKTRKYCEKTDSKKYLSFNKSACFVL